MPAFTHTVNDATTRDAVLSYDLRDILVNEALVADDNIDAVTSVIVKLQVTSDLVLANAVAGWRLTGYSQDVKVNGNYTSADPDVPVAVLNSEGIVGEDYVPGVPGHQVADGVADITYYPVDGEGIVDNDPDTRFEVELRALDDTTGAHIVGTSPGVSGTVVSLTIFYSTVQDGVSPTSCGVFGQGAFGVALFGAACSTVNASFTIDMASAATPATVNVDASSTVVTPDEPVTYSWDWGDGSVGSGETTSHLYTVPGLYRITLMAFTESGTFDSTYQIVGIASAGTDVPPKRTVEGRLGSCSIDRYSVQVTTRGGYGILADLSEWLETIDWDRVMDNTALAEVVVRKRAGCTRELGVVDPWATEMRIWRDERLVFEGPITEYDEERDVATITAATVDTWMKFRHVYDVIDREVLPGVTPTSIAREIIEQAFSRDDPRVLEYLDVRDGGDLITRKIGDAEETGAPPNAEQELRSLAGSFVDWTVVGRRIIVWPDNYYLSNIGTLMQHHLIGDGWSIRVRGDDYGSKFLMEGDAVLGTAGGISERYGLVEQTVRDDTILDTATATKAADRLYNIRGARPPRWLVIGDGAQLSAESPFDIDQLVPGVRVVVDISGDDIAQPFRQNMRLTRVSTSVDEEGEVIRIGALAIGYEGFPLGTVGEPAEAEANRPPQAVFTTSGNAGEEPYTVDFVGSGSLPGSSAIVAYEWNFGDGLFATGATVSHTFTSDGIYTVVLTVRDSNGLIDTATTQVTVVDNGANIPPVASFSYVADGLEVDFDGTASVDADGSIVSYEWDFGDGNTGAGSTVTHTYAASTSATVSLTVTDNSGAEGVTSQQVSVSDGLAGPVNMVVLGDSIANLWNVNQLGGADPTFENRSRWQDRIAADLAALEGATVTRQYWSQDGGAPPDLTPASSFGSFFTTTPAGDGGFIQWDASAPGILSDSYQNPGVYEYGTIDYRPTLPPVTAPKYVFICLGFNDRHVYNTGAGQVRRTGAQIRDNLKALADNYKDAEYIIFVGQWDAAQTLPSAPNHTAGDMDEANFGMLAAYSQVVADPTHTGTAIISASPAVPTVPTQSQDGVHPSTTGHGVYYDAIVAALQAAGVLP